MNDNCGIIDDLLPLYVDEACSEESKVAIEAHLLSCEVCRAKLAKMKADNIIPETIKADHEITMAKYAQKVKRHRIRIAISAVAISVVAAWVLSLVFLTIKDMHNQANPVVQQVEAGTYNLTANNLEVTAAEVEEYTFFTNNGQIEVSADNNVDYSGKVLLWNVDDRSNPRVILCGKITSTEKSCIFTGLSSSHRYMITCDGNEDTRITFTDGINVNFLGSIKNVLDEIFTLLG